MTNDLTWGDANLGGTSLRGYLDAPYSFEETVARLITLSGQPAKSFDGYKTSVEFYGTFRGQVFTLYDYKCDRSLNIGGHAELDVEALQGAIRDALASVDPTPYTAVYHYDESAGATHSWQPSFRA